jgi:hypothetical protein
VDLVVVVPGLDVSRHGEALERLLDGLDHHLCAAGRPHRIATRQGEGVGQATLDFQPGGGATQRLEIRELAWTDLRPSMKDVSAYVRLWRGARLSAYWIGPLLLRSVPGTSAALRRWLLVGVFATIFWYLLVVAATWHLMQPQVHDFFWPPSKPPVPDPQAGWLSRISDAMTSPKLLWAGVLALLGFKPLVDGVDISWSTYAFMVDRDSLRRKLRIRLRGMLSHVAMDSGYRRIVVVAHSFGTAVTADALGVSEHDGIPIPPLELITLGSPLEFLARRDAGMQALVERCLQTQAVQSWSDFYAPEDAFCSRVPLMDGAGGKFHARRVALGYSMLKSATGRAHNAYFERPEVLRAIMGDAG